MDEETTTGRRRVRLAVTNSEMAEFRTCRQRWWFKYEELLRPKLKPKPLTVGTTIHEGVAAMYRRIQQAQLQGVKVSLDELVSVAHEAQKLKLQTLLTAYVDLLTDDTPQYKVDEITSLAESMEEEAASTVQRFVETFGLADQERYQVLLLEHPFHVPLLDANGTRRSGLDYEGVFDLVLFDGDVGDVVLGEHKTTSSDAMEYENHLDLDTQTTAYIYALNVLIRTNPEVRAMIAKYTGDDEPICNRVLYNVIRKKGPREPGWNKPDKHGGRMVSSAAVDTTRERFEVALQEQEAQGPKYARTEKQMERLLSCHHGSRYVARHEHWHSAAVIERWRNEFHEDAKLVRDARAGRLPLSRNPSVCTGAWNRPCPMRPICIEDTPEGRRHGYIVGDHRHAEVAEAMEEAAAEESR